MNKKPAKNLIKNKLAMQRLRNKRLANKALTQKKNMTRVGQLPKAKVLSFAKKTSPKKTSPKKASPNNHFGKSIHAYKYLVAIPYAISGLHNPRSPGYHDELVENLKNYQKHNPTLAPVHNKNWALNQIKRNVYKVLNKNKSPIKIKPVNTTRYHSLAKTKKLIKNRKTQQKKNVSVVKLNKRYFRTTKSIKALSKHYQSIQNEINFILLQSTKPT